MINKLVWGLYVDYETCEGIDNNQDIKSKFYTLVNFHRLSITNANKLGYECCIYTPKHLHKYFSDLKVRIVDVPRVGNAFFDYIKNYILKTEKGEYLIIDGDLILNQRLPSIDADLLYEKKESQSWDTFYKTQVDTLTNLGIGDVVKEWTGKKRFDITNIGLLYIKNEQFKSIYIDRWDKIKNFIESNIEDGYWDYTQIGAQYMLAELIDYYKLNTKDFKSESSKNTYIHYMGNDKNTTSFIPIDKVLTFNQSFI